MTVNDAFAIHDELVHHEFPLVFSTATMFALFKTYGIPSISGLLLATGQLCDAATAPKRNADTGALLLEAVLNPPSSERAATALTRINYMHRHYRKMGKIQDSNLLYTLSLFALEPSRWVSRFEWRELSDLELCAIGTFWKSIGEALEVPYGDLPFSSSSEAEKDGLGWLNALSEWSRTYEEAYMVPAISNKRLADSTFEMILWKVPSIFHGVGRKILATLLEDKLRESMLIPKPPHIYHHLLFIGVTLRKLYLRFLSLPRIRKIQLLPEPSSSGRLHRRKYRVQPWYVRPTLKNRWGLSAWRIWLGGGVLPGDEGARYQPEGFHSEELGPAAFRGKGLEEMNENRARLLRSGQGGVCFR